MGGKLENSKVNGGAVFPKRLITFNPVQFVKLRGRKEDVDLFAEGDEGIPEAPAITHEQYLALTDYLKKKESPALLPVQIAYYTGLRIGEVCGLTWQDIHLDKQYLTVRRSIKNFPLFQLLRAKTRGIT